MPYYTGSTKGPGSNGRIDYPGYGHARSSWRHSGAARGAFALLATRAFRVSTTTDYQWRIRGGHSRRLIGKRSKEVMSNVDHMLNVDIFTDDDVEAQNRVTLSSNLPPDEHGAVPRIEIKQRNRSARTIRNREFLAKEAVRLLRELGAKKIHRVNKPPFVIHSQSTMRMGISANDSVLDENAEARHVKRLFIADNSALANGIGRSKIRRLPRRLWPPAPPKKIFQRYFGGEGWVRKEAPVSSIDAVVTQAVIKRGLSAAKQRTSTVLGSSISTTGHEAGH